MSRFQNILAIYNGTAGSEAVLEQAVAIAHAQNARLTLLRQVTAGTPLDEEHKRLWRIVPWVVQQGVVKVETAVTADGTCPEIIRRVAQDAHDLVILCAEGSSGLRRVVFGDLGKNLIRGCPCPVWILRPEQTVPCTRILAAVGDDDGDPKSQSINSRIVGLAEALARPADAELHIAHAWTPTDGDAALLTNEIADETREEILRRNEAFHRSAINKLLAQFPITERGHQIHLPRGMPQQAIVRLAARLKADVVVMGNTWRTGLPRLVLGNPGETVFRAIGCSLLSVTLAGEVASPSLDVEEDERADQLLAVGAR